MKIDIHSLKTNENKAGVATLILDKNQDYFAG